MIMAFGALLAIGANAETLTPEAALQRATKSGRQVAAGVSEPKLAYTAKTINGEPAVYVFNKAGGGSLILSASSLANPVLGYTESGEFNPSAMPPQLKYWLEEYAAQVEYLEANNIQPHQTNVAYSYPTDWKFIAPLVKTKWDQGQPYNRLLDDTATATGCVATAMAQVMKYHNYPERGHGSNTYTDVFGRTYTMNFEAQPFDWANMLDEYVQGSYNLEEANAVALLMRACGISTNMIYGGSSGTQAELAANALIKYFGYDNSLEQLQRFEYTHTEWATILYEQLSTVGPVLYSGHSLGGFAHAFVCDGYDGAGYFHINWGWSGMCDGYYSLDSMIPTVQGTGGTDMGGYNFTQAMIVNIKPSEGTPDYQPTATFTLLGNMSGKNNASVLTLSMSQANPGNLINNSCVTYKPLIGIHMENTETGDESYSQVSNVYFNNKEYTLPDMEPGSFIDLPLSVMARFDTSLPDGKYKVSLVWKEDNNSGAWKSFMTAQGCHDYVYVTKDNGKYSVESLPIYRFNVTAAQVLTPLYMRNPVDIQFTVTNPTDIELTQSIIPVLLYGEERLLSFEGDSQLVTVGPGETATVVRTYTFTQTRDASLPSLSTPKEYTLGAYDYGLLIDEYYGSGDFYDSYYDDFGTVTMKRSPSNPSIRARSLSINNSVESNTVQGVGIVYGIDDFSNISLTVKIYGENGFVATPLLANVYEFNPETNKTGNLVYAQNFDGLAYVEEGETVEKTMHINLPNYDVSKMYAIQVVYIQQNEQRVLGTVRIAASSGVEDVAAAAGLNLSYDGYAVSAASGAGLSTVAVYDMSGKTVATPACNGAESVSLSVNALPKGIYIVRATDKEGNTKTLKLNR